MGNVVVPDDVQRLEEWIAKYSDSILRSCYIYLRDLSQAQDAVQDTFIKAWKHIHTFVGNNEKAWLMRIAMNTCHDYYRSKWFRHIDMRRSLEELPPQLTAVLPQDHELLMDVYTLPEKLKQVVLLYYYQEMTLQEVADCLGINRSTVHKRLQKAHQLLRIHIERCD